MESGTLIKMEMAPGMAAKLICAIPSVFQQILPWWEIGIKMESQKLAYLGIEVGI